MQLGSAIGLKSTETSQRRLDTSSQQKFHMREEQMNAKASDLKQLFLGFAKESVVIIPAAQLLLTKS